MLPVLPNTNTHHLHLDSNNSAPRSSANKRNSSMIFRIEHLLPSATAPDITLPAPSSRATTSATAATASNTAGARASAQLAAARRNKRHNGGVHVAQFTPKDTVSEVIPTFALMSGNGAHVEQPAAAAYCAMLAPGVLRMSAALLRKVKLSEDIHSYNALFELHNGNAVRVRTVRDVPRDEELVAWFGEEITALMCIPFLTPLNIQGNKRYTCHLCHLTFETPNPLKIHLALGCGRQSLDILWIRLHYAVTAANYNQQQQQQQLLLQSQLARNIPPNAALLQHSPTTQAPSSTTSSVSPSGSPQPPPQPPPQPTTSNQRFSAFKPVPPSTTATTSCVTSISLSAPTLHTTTTAAMAPSGTLSFLQPIATPTMSTMSALSLLQPPGSNQLNAAAQIEAIVSNMGASKQGHLCIYCGKVYSRKYGLKIHIRTHTGFKPLKCKFCLRPFGDPSNLNKHVRLHLQSGAGTSTLEGFKCNLCNKTLARRRDLQRHMESRHASSGGSS